MSDRIDAARAGGRLLLAALVVGIPIGKAITIAGRSQSLPDSSLPSTAA